MFNEVVNFINDQTVALAIIVWLFCSFILFMCLHDSINYYVKKYKTLLFISESSSLGRDVAAKVLNRLNKNKINHDVKFFNILLASLLILPGLCYYVRYERLTHEMEDILDTYAIIIQAIH